MHIRHDINEIKQGTTENTLVKQSGDIVGTVGFLSDNGFVIGQSTEKGLVSNA